jgi:ATP-dependent DNA helicase PIF1
MSKRKISIGDDDIFLGKTFSTSQRRALSAVLAKGQSVFITGAGGVGKSECIKHIVTVMRERGLKVGVTAHTGIAAITIQGQTLWSFMKFNVETLKKSKEEIAQTFLKNKGAVYNLNSYRALIIDEISMVDPHVFEIMDYVIQMSRRVYTPFGGMQLILVGDFFQLPSPTEKKLTIQRYVFQSDVFWKVMDDMYDLQEMWRQRDPVFVSLLHRARRGIQTDDDLKLLRSRIGAKLPCEDNGIAPTRLYSKLDDVNRINDSEMEKLAGEIRKFSLRFGVYKRFGTKSKFDKAPSVVLKLLCDINATKYQENITKIEDILVEAVDLKVGAQVMLSYNLDVSTGLVNGARGVIIGWGKTAEERKDAGLPARKVDSEPFFQAKTDEHALYPDEKLPIVKFACGRTIEIPYVRYNLQVDDNEAYAWRIALKLAWSTSIHKSQSLTLDAAEVDLSNCFETGMAYVALSRVTSLENVRIAKEFPSSAFKIDESVVNFYDTPFGVQKMLRLGGHSAANQEAESLHTKKSKEEKITRKQTSTKCDIGDVEIVSDDFLVAALINSENAGVN